ncbi:MAG TPA: hypothetical protein VFL86_22675 [Burkholderiaceae bacterium]|nr:hypothetical protein [Burkholderiaceae bacterium]
MKSLWISRSLAGAGPCLAVAVLALCVGGAAAQNPFVDATKPDPAAQKPEPPGAAAIVRAFVEGCVVNEGDPVTATDWALNEGFLPIDPLSDEPKQLLNGQPGTVLSMPGSGGQVLMAVAADRRCTVWTERALGPGVRNALRQSMADLAAKGAQVQPLVDRSIERAGAWRQYEQMRYRRVGGAQDFAVASVTTLTSRPGVQALNFGPYAAGPARDPDGLQNR